MSLFDPENFFVFSTKIQIKKWYINKLLLLSKIMNYIMWKIYFHTKRIVWQTKRRELPICGLYKLYSLGSASSTGYMTSTGYMVM